MFAVLFLICPAHAQDDDLKRQHDALFQQVLRAPGNVDLSLRYAEIATRRGDYEAAIGAFERLVFTQPDRADYRYELGVLYFRLGSYDLARSYFESATASPDATQAIDNRSAAFLDEIERRLQTTRLSFSGLAGLRFQSNANAGQNAAFMRVFGADIALSKDYARKPDWNWFMGGTLRSVHDLETQRGDLIETQVGGYYARQFNLTKLNAGILDASLGPRLSLAPDLLPGWSVKPYLAATLITLGDVPYAASPGFGLSLAMPFDTVLVEPGYENRRRRYLNSTENPAADDQSGRFHLGYLALSGRLTADLRWNARLGMSRANARVAHFSHGARSVDVGLAYEFQAFAALKDRWTIAPFLGLTATNYDQPNASIDPNVRRRDREWRVGARLDAPLWENAGLSAVIQYSRTLSSLPNYRMHNLSVSFGPTVRF